MAMRSPAGFISAFFDPLMNPSAPTSPAATAGDTLATVSFTAPANVGGSAITAYYAVANDGTTGTAASSPVTVTGLTNGTAYTFNVWALNSYGPGVWSAATGSVTPAQLQRGLFAGGGPSNTINYINIASTGNATSFGQLTSSVRGNAGVGSTTRGVNGGGAGGPYTSVMDYVTFATTGNASSFGVLTQAVGYLAACNSATRGVWGNGYTGGFTSVMSYVTIATTGNATSFGNIAFSTYGLAACSSPTRGIFAGGDDGSQFVVNIGYITIASAGGTTNFGNLSVGNRDFGGCSSSTRGLFAGGLTYPGSAPYLTAITYITIASTGNATTFGNLTAGTQSLSACSSETRGTFVSIGGTSAIDYVTIATTGNATNFGYLPAAQINCAAFSSCNGGVQ